MVEEQEKCKFCGKSHFTQSTEQKDTVWVSNKICESCGKVVKTHNFRRELNIMKENNPNHRSLERKK